jgi:hypothetical protein
MRRFSRAIITGSLAFSLVAAAAAGTAFTVNSVEGVALTAAAADSVAFEPCTGAYDITWAVSSGVIEGVQAKRVVPNTTSDPGLAFCKDMPYAIYVVNDIDDLTLDGSGRLTNRTEVVALFADGDATLEWIGTTDATTGDVNDLGTAPTTSGLILDQGAVVVLVIGPLAWGANPA